MNEFSSTSNPFHFNAKGLQVYTQELCGSTIYTVENFYSNPDEVVEFILSREAPIHKQEEAMSRNGLDFEDRRLNILAEGMEKVTDFLSGLCGETPCGDARSLITNQTLFYVNGYNPYEDKVWWPHRDPGYTALVYLNKGTTSGTNLYVPTLLDPFDSLPEHAFPWKPRHLWPVLKTITARYNRMVLFDGAKFAHGASINDDRFFWEVRLNQAVFFQPSTRTPS